MQTPTPQATPKAIPASHYEHILVIPRVAIPGIDTWHGIKPYQEVPVLDLIQKYQEYHLRYLMEENTGYKQIIPYIVFMHGDKLFMMERAAHASEQRLRSKISLGIGGHLNQKDLQGIDIMQWAAREFAEEVDFQGNYTVTPIGALNDDTNAVGQVHLGLVLLLQGDSDRIAIKDEHAHGCLVSWDQLQSRYNDMETWSQIVYNYLKP